MEPLLVILAVAILLAVLLVLFSMNRPARDMAKLHLEMQWVRERVQTIEQSQGSVGQNLLHLQGTLGEARLGLTTLQTQATTRADIDQQVAESVRRLETIIAGTYSKGAAGENILDVVFSKLPPEWQVRDFRVGNHTVEFGLRLPNNRVLPIDSKWPASGLVERLAACHDSIEQRRLRDQIDAAVIAKAREVTKYIDPNLTLSFGIAAVPDSVYELCGDAQAACLQLNVVVLAYSMFIPYLLLVFQTVLKTSQDIDLEKLDAHLRMAEQSVHSLQQELEGRFSRAIAMLGNSKAEMSAQLSRVSTSLTNVHVHTGSDMEPEDSALEVSQYSALAQPPNSSLAAGTDPDEALHMLDRL